MQFQKISIIPPQKGLEFPGAGGSCKTKAYLEIPEGGKVFEKDPFCLGGLDIFCNSTLSYDQLLHR